MFKNVCYLLKSYAPAEIEVSGNYEQTL